MAVIIVASVTATNDYNKQLQFRALAQESQRRVEVPVRRGGETLFVGTVEVVVGDVVLLGEQPVGEGHRCASPSHRALPSPRQIRGRWSLRTASCSAART